MNWDSLSKGENEKNIFGGWKPTSGKKIVI